MRLVGRGWYQSLSGAYEEPPATPVGYFYHSVLKPRHLNKGFADKHLKIEEGIAYLPLYETSLLWWCIFPLFFVIH